MRTPLALLCGLVVAVAPLATAQQASSPKTLKDCAALLPAGGKYEIEVKGTYDTTGKTPEFHGTIAVDDGTRVDRQNEAQAAPFRECIAKVVGAV